MTYCLDSWVILEWLDGVEPAASFAEEIIESRPFMSWINLGEVFYIAARRDGESAARDVLQRLRPQLALELPSAERVLQAAKIKAAHPVSYGDAFGLATAIARNALFVTGDPEILQGDPNWPTYDPLSRQSR